ncbi:MAG: GrpB family protein [Chloroflexi bacterium]|nr:MAG: GrpB family protein [Chloroflexota bacterium]
MTLGLQRGSVNLVPHSNEWGTLFEEERTRIITCLRGKTVAIEHVGSTAIPDIPAKPILDIAVGIPDVGAICEYIQKLKQIGYEYRGDISGDGDYTFAKGPDSRRTHYVHIVALDSPKWEEYLLFRDYLRNHEEERKEYAALKSTLAEKYGSDRDSYTQGKQEFIRRVVELARTELGR